MRASGRKLRVLTLTNYCFPGGTSNRVLGMAHGLDRERFDHHVVTITEPSPEIDARYGSTLPDFERSGIAVECLGERPAGGSSGVGRIVNSAGRIRSSVEKLARIVRERKIDVIDAHNAAANIVAVLTGRVTGTPSIVTLYYVGPPAHVALWPLVGRVSLDLATAEVTDSHTRATDIRAWMYRRKHKISVIPNGVPLRSSTLTRAQARQKLGVPLDATIVTQVAGLVPHKGAMVLLDAAERVVARQPNAHVLIVGFSRGESAFEDALRARVRERGIGNRVTIRGYEGPIEDVWAATDIQVHASLFDSLPAAIIEAMSASVPAIATSVGGIPELVRDGETGWIVPPNDATSIACALERALDDPEIVRRFGSAAFRRYQDHYTPERTSRQLEELFERCASTSR